MLIGSMQSAWKASRVGFQLTSKFIDRYRQSTAVHCAGTASILHMRHIAKSRECWTRSLLATTLAECFRSTRVVKILIGSRLHCPIQPSSASRFLQELVSDSRSYRLGVGLMFDQALVKEVLL